MKKIISLALAFFASAAFAQTFPVNNLAVSGTASFAVAPTSVTPAISDNSTKLITSAFVKSSLPCPNIISYGGSGNGVTDNGAAFAAALAANPSGSACVYFPAGNFAFSNSAVYTFPTANPSSVTILGAGADNTILTFSAPSVPGLAIAFKGPFNSAHIRDMTIASSINPSNNTGLLLQQTAATIPNPANSALSDVTNVTFRGADGYVASDAWSFSVEASGVSNINFTNDYFVGPTAGTVGVLLTGSSTALGVVYNFSGCTFNFIGIGIQYAQWIQGVTVSQSNFTGGTQGIVVPASQPGLDELLVWGNQFNVTGNGVLDETGIESTQIFGNIFLVPNGANGVQLFAAGNSIIQGNTFEPANPSPSANNGLVISGTVNNWPVIVTGNSFLQMAGDGIQLGSGSRNVNVQSNVYSGNGTNVLNAGTGNTIGGGSQ